HHRLRRGGARYRAGGGTGRAPLPGPDGPCRPPGALRPARSDPKQGKVRIQLDLGAADLRDATARIQALGGTWDGEDRILDGVEWRTFADPEGHEFDILRVGSP